jgi:voltage-gated potassium channel
LRLPDQSRVRRFAGEILTETYFLHLVSLLLLLWLLFTFGLFLAERAAGNPLIDTWGEALYWGVAAFSTAGIADTPVSGAGRLLGGAWIVVGSTLFFGTIVATITGFFMRPVQRPAKKLVETIEFNLEHLDDLSIEELELLQATTDSLIQHVERLRTRHAGQGRPGPANHATRPGRPRRD